MLDTLVSHLTSSENYDVRAIYLHVLTTNSQAIHFYEKRGFKPHLFLPYYYNIKGKLFFNTKGSLLLNICDQT